MLVGNFQTASCQIVKSPNSVRHAFNLVANHSSSNPEFPRNLVPCMHCVLSITCLLLCYSKRKLARTTPAARHKDQFITSFDDPDVVSNGLPPPTPLPLCDVDVEVEVTPVDVDVDD